jgi:N-acetylmuramic acid 6-phosphate (MurNAc-6-P) etherase
MEPDVVIAIGTTGLFPYIIRPFHRAIHLGKVAAVIDPNPSKNLVETCNYVIKEKAEIALPNLFKDVIKSFSKIQKLDK